MANTSVFDEIKETIGNLKWGSVEVIVQDGEVTQISTRIIKKTATKQQSKVIGKVRKSGKGGINLNFKY